MPEIRRLKGDCAVSSSGDYERFVLLEGKSFGHILDTTTGIPAPGKIAVTAVPPSGTSSDWLSTAVYLRGKKLAKKLHSEVPDIKFYIFEKEKF
jgi:thiamine biosynthesis lipoprotein